jgi:hypothetical protein
LENRSTSENQETVKEVEQSIVVQSHKMKMSDDRSGDDRLNFGGVKYPVSKVLPKLKSPDRDASWYEEVILTNLPPDPSEQSPDPPEPPHSDSVVTVPPQPKPPDPNLHIVAGVIHQTQKTGISVHPRLEEPLWEEITNKSPWKHPSRKPTQLKKNLRKWHVSCSYITPPPKPPDDELPPTAVEAPLVETTAVEVPLIETVVVEGSPWLKKFADLRKGDQGAISTICKLSNFLILLGQAQIDLNDWGLHSCLLKLILEVMCQIQLDVRELELIVTLTCQTQIKAKMIAKKQFEFVAASPKRKILVPFTRMYTLVHAAIKKSLVLIPIPNHSFDILMDTHAAMELSKPYVVL